MNVPIPVDDQIEEIVDLEECAKSGKPHPPRARKYRIRIDREKFVVDVPAMTGRQLLELAGKKPPEQFMIVQKERGKEPVRIELDEKADFTKPGVERFMTMPLNVQEG